MFFFLSLDVFTSEVLIKTTHKIKLYFTEYWIRHHYLFSNTYTIVQQNANKVWHWQNYHLVVEYQKRSFMPPPFSIFSHIKVFVQYLLRARQKRIIEEADLEGKEILFLKDPMKM